MVDGMLERQGKREEPKGPALLPRLTSPQPVTEPLCTFWPAFLLFYYIYTTAHKQHYRLHFKALLKLFLTCIRLDVPSKVGDEPTPTSNIPPAFPLHHKKHPSLPSHFPAHLLVN